MTVKGKYFQHQDICPKTLVPNLPPYSFFALDELRKQSCSEVQDNPSKPGGYTEA